MMELANGQRTEVEGLNVRSRQVYTLISERSRHCDLENGE